MKFQFELTTEEGKETTYLFLSQVVPMLQGVLGEDSQLEAFVKMSECMLQHLFETNQEKYLEYLAVHQEYYAKAKSNETAILDEVHRAGENVLEALHGGNRNTNPDAFS